MQRINTNWVEHGFYVGGDCHLLFSKADEDTNETVDKIGTLHKSIVQGNTLDLAAQSNTTRSLDGFLEFSTRWCGRYHFVA